MKALILALLVWITSNSDLEYKGQPLPTIYQEAEPRELYLIVYGELHEGWENTEIVAAYNHGNNTIYFRRGGVDLTTFQGKGDLVHELVHYLQYLSGSYSRVGCIRQLEPRAYHIQARYLKEHGDPSEEQEVQSLLRGYCG